MNTMQQRFARVTRFTIATTLTAAVLAGCGGSSGDDGGVGGPGGSSPAPLAAGNYVTAASVAIETSVQVFSLQEIFTGAQVAGGDRVLQIAVARASEWPHRRRTTETLSGATVTETEQCSQGGSISYQFTEASELRTTVGDRANITFSNCRELGTTTNGSLDATIDSLSGDIDNTDRYRIVLSVIVNRLATNDGTASYVGNGRMTLTVESYTFNRQDISLSLPSFSVSGQVAGASYDRTLTGMIITSRLAENGDMTLEVDGRIAASELNGGYVDIDTTTPFFEARSDNWPRSGVALIQGAEGSRVRLTAQPSGLVLIELDEQGDGTYETSTTRTWDELQGG